MKDIKIKIVLIVTIIIVIMIIVYIAGCNNQTERVEKSLIFRGESHNWQAEYITYYVEIWEEINNKLHYKNEVNDGFILKYKNNDIENVGRIKYEYSTATTTGGGTTSLNDEGIASDASKAGGAAI
jgi:hypothetical protein